VVKDQLGVFEDEAQDFVEGRDGFCAFVLHERVFKIKLKKKENPKVSYLLHVDLHGTTGKTSGLSL
jgi:hypothetical protein